MLRHVHQLHHLATCPDTGPHLKNPTPAQEGETEDAGVLALRCRQMRNLMLALMLAQGTPMVLMGAPSSLLLLS